MPNESFDASQDAVELQSIKADTVDQITRLFGQSAPKPPRLVKVLPPYFRRLLLVYDTLITSMSEEQLSKLKDHEEAGPLLDWFRKYLPGVEDKPGYGRVIRWATDEAKKEGLDTDALVGKESASEEVLSLAGINSFSSQQYLLGEKLVPVLRVFLKNKDKILLDSTGDWDDWMFVAKCVLGAMDSQSASIENFDKAWENVPFEKVNKHLKLAKKSLRSFERRLKEKMPDSVSRPKKKKSGAARSGRRKLR